IRVAMFAASEEATSGSVIENADRMRPSSSGSSQRSFCSGEANSESSSMLPVSGAEQLSASGASHGLRPVISASGAYCRLVSPAPPSWIGGRNRFHRPRSRAWALSSAITGGVAQGSGDRSTSSRKRGSAGYTYSSMNASSRSRSSRVVASKAKSMGLAVRPDRIALLEEGLHALARVLRLVRDVAGHALERDQRLGVAVEAAVGRELGDAHRERALVLHRRHELGDRLLELPGRRRHVRQ